VPKSGVLKKVPDKRSYHKKQISGEQKGSGEGSIISRWIAKKQKGEARKTESTRGGGRRSREVDGQGYVIISTKGEYIYRKGRET